MFSQNLFIQMQICTHFVHPELSIQKVLFHWIFLIEIAPVKTLGQSCANFYDIFILDLWTQLFDESNFSICFEIASVENLSLFLYFHLFCKMNPYSVNNLALNWLDLDFWLCKILSYFLSNSIFIIVIFFLIIQFALNLFSYYSMISWNFQFRLSRFYFPAQLIGNIPILIQASGVFLKEFYFLHFIN